MALISSGVEKVRAYALPAGIWASGKPVKEPLSVLVCWQSQYDDKLFQIYVNGRLCGFTEDVLERQAVISFRSSWHSSIRIEVFAVEPLFALNDYGEEIDFAAGNRVRLSWIKKSNIPPDAVIDIFSNNGSGEIDYQVYLEKGLPFWDVWQDKWGFGLAGFGAGGFGYDGAGAVGFGRGNFGRGEFGFDSEESDWISEELTAGEYRFGIQIRNKDGVINDHKIESGMVTVLPSSKGAEDLSVSSFDKNENLLTFAII